MPERSRFFEINLVESSSNDTLETVSKISEKPGHKLLKIRSKLTSFNQKTQVSCFSPTKHVLTKSTNKIKHVISDSLSKFRSVINSRINFKPKKRQNTRKSRFNREVSRRYRPEIRLTTDNTIETSVSFTDFISRKSEKIGLPVRKTKSDLELQQDDNEKFKSVLKILQTNWITSLAGINFQKGRQIRRSGAFNGYNDLEGRNRFESELFHSTDFDVHEITGNLADFDFAKKYAQIDAKNTAQNNAENNAENNVKNNAENDDIQTFVKNVPAPKTFTNLTPRKQNPPKNPQKPKKQLSELKTADPNNYHPKDFYAPRPDSHKVESEEPECEREVLIDSSKPKPAKVYSSYKNRTVSEFEYRDYSFGDFRQNQNELSKNCVNKELLGLNLPVFVEDGSAAAIVGKDYLCE
jgi:hypothetical protein